MIPFDEAYRLVMESAPAMGAERVDLGDALGRVLAEDVASDVDVPPFDKSAMDGYACRKADLQNPLTVVETIAAGHWPTRRVGPNECAKIMTGAAVPEGADCVIMVEHTETTADGCVRFLREKTRTNICLQAEDITCGDTVLRRGQEIRPQCVAVLATVGCAAPLVTKRPRVGVIATGDELVEPAVTPAPSQIRNSNSHQLVAQATAAGALPTYFGIAGDTVEATDRLLKDAMAASDVLLLSGGVSVGDFDFVPDVLEKNGFELLIRGIAMKPGRPTHFGVSGAVACFALPGNPVSTFIQFEILVKPFLRKMMGHEYRASCSELPLAADISRKRADREAWLPVTIGEDGAVRVVEYHGSAHINALTVADGLVTVPAGIKELKRGTSVRVRHI